MEQSNRIRQQLSLVSASPLVGKLFSRPHGILQFPPFMPKVSQPSTLFSNIFWHPKFKFAILTHVHLKLVIYDRQATHTQPKRDTAVANKMYDRVPGKCQAPLFGTIGSGWLSKVTVCMNWLLSTLPIRIVIHHLLSIWRGTQETRWHTKLYQVEKTYPWIIW